VQSPRLRHAVPLRLSANVRAALERGVAPAGAAAGVPRHASLVELSVRDAR